MSWIEFSGIVVAIVIYGTLLAMRSRFRDEKTSFVPAGAHRLPSVAVLVPVTGGSADMEECLGSIVCQDYPAYEVVFITRGMEDEAVPVIGRVIDRSAGPGVVRHVISPPARTCGQKNQNLLSGIETLGPDVEVLVFFDGSHVAPPHYLGAIVGPIAKGEAEIATSYHHILPQDGKISSLGRAITVLCLYVLQGIPRISQPWGGSTAISRGLFERLEVAEVWAQNVVDDVSLALLLKESGTVIATVPAAAVSTRPGENSFSDWQSWLVRQLLYLKFCFPGSWAAGGLVLYLLTGLILIEFFRVVKMGAGEDSFGRGLGALLFLMLLSGIGLALRKMHPKPGSPLRWLAAFYANIFMAGWCHVRTLFAREIRWRGIVYRVGPGGKVSGIRRE